MGSSPLSTLFMGMCKLLCGYPRFVVQIISLNNPHLYLLKRTWLLMLLLAPESIANIYFDSVRGNSGPIPNCVLPYRVSRFPRVMRGSDRPALGLPAPTEGLQTQTQNDDKNPECFANWSSVAGSLLPVTEKAHNCTKIFATNHAYVLNSVGIS